MYFLRAGFFVLDVSLSDQEIKEQTDVERQVNIVRIFRKHCDRLECVGNELRIHRELACFWIPLKRFGFAISAKVKAERSVRALSTPKSLIGPIELKLIGFFVSAFTIPRKGSLCGKSLST